MKIIRKELKKSARQILRENYVMALAMSIVICIAGATTYQINTNRGESAGQIGESYASESAESYPEPLSASESTVAVLNLTGFMNSVISIGLSFLPITLQMDTVAALLLLSILFRIFAGYSLEVGARRWFIETARGRQTGFGTLKSGFGIFYRNILFTMYLRSLLVLLWTMLFIIPGIIKSYSYIFVPYILADNPNLSSRRVLGLSKQITSGYKFKIFILGLTFIGWQLLGILFMLVGQALVWPYIDATYAGLYLRLRENAIEKGVTTNEELGIVI